MTFLRTALLATPLVLALSAAAQDSASLASKSIAQVYAVQNRLFAFAEDGATYSRLNLFGNTPEVVTRGWPWDGGAEGGASWSASLLLRANYWPVANDSIRVARVTSLRYDGNFRGGDSLVFRDPLDTTAGLADGAGLTALAVRARPDTSVAALGFGRLGIAYARLAPELGNTPLFEAADSLVRFVAFPSSSDSAVNLYACRWNRPCRVDTLSGAPALDSVISLAVDSTAPDTAWLLIGTQKGLRRGRWGGLHFPYVALPGIDSAGTKVRSVFTAPSRRLAWAFGESRYFFSDDHGATWRVPPAVSGVSYNPANLTNYSQKRPPWVAFHADTSFVNFNLLSSGGLGLVAFRRDTVLPSPVIRPFLGEVLIDTADGLDITEAEGELTMLAVAREGNASVLAVGTTIKGLFYRRLDQPGAPYLNMNRLRPLKGELQEVITYPTLYNGFRMVTRNGGLIQTNEPDFVHIGYRLKSDAKVTITVHNYAMEKVRTIVRNAPRRGGVARSENIAEDRWDGLDESGRRVSVGTYYVLVQSSGGDKAFGKVIVVREKQ